MENFIHTATGALYVGADKHVTVPEQIEGQTVRYIHPECFKGTDIESVSLPKTLVEISASAFQQCRNLQQVKISNGIQFIAGASFQGCNSITSITIPPSIKEIGSYAFDECTNLTEVIFEGNVEYIGAYAFSDTALKAITLPEGIEHLGNSMFFNCQKLAHVTIPQTVKTIGQCTFAGCIALQNVTLPKQVTAILDGAFEYCRSLREVTLLSIPRFVHSTAFRDCLRIEDVTAPMTMDEQLELYDEKRYLFQHDIAAVQQYAPIFMNWHSFFENAKIITFDVQAGPDYRLGMHVEDMSLNAHQLFAEAKFEKCVELLQPTEQQQELLLLAKSYEALGMTIESLQTYKRYFENFEEEEQLLLTVGKLVMADINNCTLEEQDYISIARKFVLI